MRKNTKINYIKKIDDDKMTALKVEFAGIIDEWELPF